MPLRFEGNNPDYEILASGVPDSITTQIATLDGPGVVAWSTMRLYKDQDIDAAQVAEQLGATHVVDGTVRVIGNSLQVTAELFDATTNLILVPYNSGSRQLSLENVLSTQNEIAAAIAGELEVGLAASSVGDPDDLGTENFDAYLAYVTGREALADRRGSQIDAAIDNFLGAIELDPGYAAPYAGMHDACWLHLGYAYARHPECTQGGKAYLDKALELDNTLGEAWTSRGQRLSIPGFTCELSDEEKNEAMNALRKGLILSPANAQAYHWYSNFLNDPCAATSEDQYATNRIEAEKVLLKGMTVAPLYAPFYQNRAYRHSRQGDVDAAFDVARTMRTNLPDAYNGYLLQAQLEYSTSGRANLYIKYMLEAYARNSEAWPYLVQIADAYTSLGDFAKARQYLRLAEDRMPSNTWMPWRPHVSRAVVSLLDEGPSAAEASLREMLDIEGIWIVPLWLLFNLEFTDGRIDEADVHLRELNATCDSPGNQCWPVRYLGTARIMQAQGDGQAARNLVQETWEQFRETTERRGLRRTGVYGIGIHEARVLSLLGERGRALDELHAAVDDGWRGFYGFDTGAGTTDRFYWSPGWRFDAKYDVLLDGIRDDPRFDEAFDIVERDMAEQLASLCEMERNGELHIPEAIAALDAQAECRPDQP